jgi:hypothetical protein
MTLSILMAVWSAVLALSPLSPTHAPTPKWVTIEAHDYAFTAPAVVQAGATVFRFVNHGRVPHEVQLFRFNANVSATAARAYLATGNVPDSVADANGGVLIAPPGGTTREMLYVELRAGERYALMCQFHDSPGKPMHSTLGMVALLEVR